MKKWEIKPARDMDLSLHDSLRSHKRESGLLSRCLHLLSWTVLKLYLCGFHSFRTSGTSNLPATGPFVLVANHSSHLDTIALAAALPFAMRGKVTPIAAGDTFFTSFPMAAFSSLFINALPMWRKAGTAHAINDLRDRLIQSDAIYILYPEGTRTRNGEMGTFKPGIGMIIADTSVPIIPCYLDGCFEALPAGKSKPRRTPIKLSIGEPVLFVNIPNNRDGWSHTAKALQESVRTLKSS